jgi:hypothetical protein
VRQPAVAAGACLGVVRAADPAEHFVKLARRRRDFGARRLKLVGSEPEDPNDPGAGVAASQHPNQADLQRVIATVRISPEIDDRDLMR